MWGVVGRGRQALAPIFIGVVAILMAAAPAASAAVSARTIGTPGPGAATTQSGSSQTSSAPACSQPSPAQTFISSGDFNYYFGGPAPTDSGFDGSSWSLTGGATVVSAQRADGSTGSVLDLPAGSQAVSPDVCVTAQDPQARLMVQSLNNGDNVQVSAQYYTSSGWSNPQGVGNAQGQRTAWTASQPLNLHPDPHNTGWQIMRFILVPGGGHSEFHVYGLNITAPPPTPDTGPCSNPVLSQTFLPSGDSNYYTPAPGQSAGGFIGTGWTLTGGASIVTTTRADGSSGSVLDLPAGSMAVSPDICVTSLYPTARMMIRSLGGGDDISFRVSYGDTNTWTNPHETGHVHGNLSNWTLSDSVNLQPGNVAGWQIVRLTLVPDGGHSEFQLYDLELDPYAKG